MRSRWRPALLSGGEPGDLGITAAVNADRQRCRRDLGLRVGTVGAQRLEDLAPGTVEPTSEYGGIDAGLGSRFGIAQRANIDEPQRLGLLDRQLIGGGEQRVAAARGS